MEAPAGKFRRRAPPAPQNVQVTPGFEGLHISWTPVEGATSYIVLRSTSPDGPFVAVASGLTQPHYVDLTAALNTDYYYKIVAQSGAGRGEGSAPVQGRKESKDIVIVITGNRVLKLLRPTQDQLEPSQRGKYRAYVFEKTTDSEGKVSIKQVTRQQLLAGSGFSHGPNTSGKLRILNETRPDGQDPEDGDDPPPSSRAEITCLEMNSQDLDKTFFVSFKYTANVSGYGPRSVYTQIKLAALQRLHVIYRFPANNPGRTKRTSPDGGDLFTNEAVEDDTDRLRERQEWAYWFSDHVQAILQQAGIGLYVRVDNSTKLKLKLNGPAFEVTETVKEPTRTYNMSTDEFYSLRNEVQDRSAIHVFLFEQLGHRGEERDSETIGMASIDGGYIVLSDKAEAVTLAHEFGHILNLYHVEDIKRHIAGYLNNLRPVYGDDHTSYSPYNPLNWNLMRGEVRFRRSGHSGSWLTEFQADSAYMAAPLHRALKSRW